MHVSTIRTSPNTSNYDIPTGMFFVGNLMSSCHNLWSLWPNHNIHQPGPRFPWNKGTSLPKSYLFGEIGRVRSMQFNLWSQKLWITDHIPFKLPLVLLVSKTKKTTSQRKSSWSTLPFEHWSDSQRSGFSRNLPKWSKRRLWPRSIFL